ncbi:hypothetical protein NADFUDRAFT_82136 [Nadsonia fulvescens var. elongata DSM 6958]|uniref:BAR domain-containing protein n=1 Tax=Nadsonia fulvescens var. elongata DSM 6958 TaxID=857566 RepID=A0A1E3PMU5_9ASCO|nr:hypothetical protein NADFUDRAFT_82136 [Nadsonia fulvescens var. elongata DSM 6958]
MSFNFGSLNSSLKSLQGTLQSSFTETTSSLKTNVTGLKDTITPFAQRTTRLIQEKLGNAEEITELPTEYVVLERKIDALKLVHQRLLLVTAQFENPSYDYPPNLKESFLDLGKNIQGKVQELSHATSAAEAQAILLSNVHSESDSSTSEQPKTLNHTLARAAAASAAALRVDSSPAEDDEEDNQESLALALEKYAKVSQLIGNARLTQDSEIIHKFNHNLTLNLNTKLQFATQARKNVYKARFNLDAAKSTLASHASNVDIGAAADAKAREQVEQAEDEFVAATEEAVTVMKNTLDTPDLLRNLTELIQAQLKFHKAAVVDLESIVDEVEQLKDAQEIKYRESREN